MAANARGLRVLVDAHNLIHADASLRALMREPQAHMRNAEAARRALEERLANRASIELIYDGGPGGVAASHHRRGLRVRYSGADEADDTIVAMLRSDARRPVAVVTDDRELSRRARQLGARVIGCAAFLASLPDAPAHVADRAPPSDADVRFWMKTFGVDDDGQITDSQSR